MKRRYLVTAGMVDIINFGRDNTLVKIICIYIYTYIYIHIMLCNLFFSGFPYGFPSKGKQDPTLMFYC